MLKMKHLLNNCLSYAEFNDHIKKNPITGLKSLPKSKKEEKKVLFLNEEQVSIFVNEATRFYSNGKPVYKYGNGFVLLLYTGLRCGEALNLKWKDIDFEGKTLTVRGNVIYIKNRNKKDESAPNYVLKADTATKTSNSLREVILAIVLCKHYYP